MSMKKKVLFGVTFVVLAFAVMFMDAMFYSDFNSKQSMAIGHGAHGSLAGQEGFLEINELFDFPFVTDDTKIDRLPYVMVDGYKEFHLTVDEIMWAYSDNKYVHAWAFNSQLPGPEIRVTEGDKVRVNVENNLPVPTSVHWHGVHVPYLADGVPGYSQYPIEPGETFTYEFVAKPAGSRFYHAHGSNEMGSVTQTDMGMTGAMVIEPKEPVSDITYDREYILVLDEFEIGGDGSNGALKGLAEGGGHLHAGHASGPGYNTFTINGKIDPFIDPIYVKEGERILIRLINVGQSTFHPMHIHGHNFRVVARDGNPIPRDQQRIFDVITLDPAERVDVEIVADNPGAWVFHCHELHHAAAGMNFPFLYEGYEPCCLDT